MNSNENSINWFEISVADISRTKKFYEAIFDIKLEESEMMGMKMASFPYEPGNGKVAGGLVQSDFHKPSADGVKVHALRPTHQERFIGAGHVLRYFVV